MRRARARSDALGVEAGRSARRPGSRRTPPPGARPTSSARGDRRVAARPPRRPRASGTRVVVLDVHRDLRLAAARRELEADRAHARQPLGAALADAARRSPCASSSVAGGASSTLNATSGGRAATSVAPAVGCGARRAEVGLQLAAAMRRASSLRAAAAQLGARAARRRARRRGTPAARSSAREQVGGDERLGAGGAAVGRVEVDDRRDVERADVRVHALVRGAGRSARRPRARPRAAPAPASPGSPASVKTQRLWSGSEWTSSSSAPPRARERVADRVDRRVVAPLGDVGDGEQHGRSAHSDPAAGVEHAACRRRRASARDDDVEVDRDGDGPADAGARAERDVDGAEDLLVLEHVAGERRAVVRADAELGEVAALRAVRVERARGSVGARRPFAASAPSRDLEAQRLGLRGRVERGSSAATIVPSPPAGAMKPSPHGQVAEGAGAR